MPLSPRFPLRAKFPIDEAWIEVWEGVTRCEACGRETRFLSSVQVDGPLRDRFSLAELGAIEGLFDTICEPLLPYIVAYRIAKRPSLARGRWCLSNGCMHCGAFIGEYDDFDAWADKARVETFPLRLDAEWRRAMLEFTDALRTPRRRLRRNSQSQRRTSAL